LIAPGATAPVKLAGTRGGDPRGDHRKLRTRLSAAEREAGAHTPRL